MHLGDLPYLVEVKYLIVFMLYLLYLVKVKLRAHFRQPYAKLTQIHFVFCLFFTFPNVHSQKSLPSMWKRFSLYWEKRWTHSFSVWFYINCFLQWSWTFRDIGWLPLVSSDPGIVHHLFFLKTEPFWLEFPWNLSIIIMTKRKSLKQNMPLFCHEKQSYEYLPSVYRKHHLMKVRLHCQ